MLLKLTIVLCALDLFVNAWVYYSRRKERAIVKQYHETLNRLGIMERHL